MKNQLIKLHDLSLPPIGRDMVGFLWLHWSYADQMLIADNDTLLRIQARGLDEMSWISIGYRSDKFA